MAAPAPSSSYTGGGGVRGAGLGTAGWSRRSKLAAFGAILALGAVAAVIAIFAPKGGPSSPSSSSPAAAGKVQSSSYPTQAVDGGLTGASTVAAPGSSTKAESTPTSTVKVPSLVNDKQAVAGGTCYAANWDELVAAVTVETCPTIVLTGTTYEVEDELVVARSVTITGDVATLPYFNLDEDAPRTFRVMEGVYFQLRYVTLVMAEGTRRAPLPFEFATSEEVLEIRGGSVLFEDGALGGMFVGVFFVDDPDPVKGLNEAIEQITEGITIRVYGGHVYATSGEIDFIGCMFYDLTLLYPGPNFVQIGGDVLILFGTLTFTGCVWLENTVFGVENGAGLFVANIAGSSYYTGCVFDENNAAVLENAIGQAFLVSGGVQVMTGSSISEFSALIAFTGTGELTVNAGVSILTGVPNEEAFAIGAEFGIGMEYTVGAGVHVQTGSAMHEWNGIFAMAGLGELSFLGSGTYISTGSTALEYLSILDENGEGGVMFNGGGYSSWQGNAIFDLACLAAAYITGEYLAQNAGFLTFVEGVWFETAVIEFTGGLGSILFVGGGAAVLYNAILLEYYGPIVQRSIEFWITGTCEEAGAEGGAEGGSGGGGSEGGAEGGRFLKLPSTTDTSTEEAAERHLIEQRNRDLYVLPIFVPPAFGCGKYDAFSRISGGEGGGRRLMGSEEQEDDAEEEAGLMDNETQGTAMTTVTTTSGSGRDLAEVFRNGGPLAHLPKHVRRQATNLHGAKGRRALLDYQDMGVSLYAANVVRKTELDASTRASMSNIMPKATFEFWDGIKDKMNALLGIDGEGSAAVSPESHPAFHIDADLDGYCGLCNVPGVTGAGMRTCEVQESCDTLDAPPTAKYFTPEGGDRLLAEGEGQKYDEHRIMTVKVEAVTSATVDKLDLVELQEAIVASIANIQGKDPDRETVLVTMWGGDELHPLFNGTVRRPGESIFRKDETQKTHHATVGIVATSQETEDLLIAALEGIGADGSYNDDLVEGIKAAFFENTATVLHHLELEYHKGFFVAAYKSKEMRNNRHRDLGDHSILVLDPQQLARPVTHIQFGQPYHLYLDNWPSRTKVDMRLLKFQEEGETEPFSMPIDNVATNQRGELQMDISFDQRALRDGEYYFQATLPTGEVSFSPSYIVSHQPQRRRLYGPDMIM